MNKPKIDLWLALGLWAALLGTGCPVAAEESVEPNLTGVLDDSRWSPEFALPHGCNNQIFAADVGPDDMIYLGGNFTACGDIQATHLVRHDPTTQTWSTIGDGSGEGTDGPVHDLLVAGNRLFIAGSFDNVNNGDEIVANRIAEFELSSQSWSSLGSGGGNGVGGGTNVSASALAWDGNNLYVGGQFQFANAGADIIARNVARWDGSQWHSLGTNGAGTDDAVWDLELFSGDLYVGGEFQSVNVGPSPVTAPHIARWDGAAWSRVGGIQGFNSRVQALASIDDWLYAGGIFSTVQNEPPAQITANSVARWDGNAWEALPGPTGQGVSGQVLALAGYDGQVYVGGAVSQANIGDSFPVNNLARWDSTNTLWSGLDSGTGNGVDSVVSHMVSTNDGVLIAGHFLTSNPATASTDLLSRVGVWNGSGWQAIGNSQGLGINGAVLAVTTGHEGWYVGGNFSHAGTTQVNGLAYFDGTQWQAVGNGGNGTDGVVRALVMVGNSLYVGGQFSLVNQGSPVTANNLARWDGSDWYDAGNGVDNDVHALLADGDDVIVGGDFISVNLASPLTANHLAVYNPGTGWNVFGSGTPGVDGSVRALAHGPDGLYVGGLFNTVHADGPVAADRIARLGLSGWESVGSAGGQGLSDSVLALAVIGPRVYAGGQFTTANVGNPIVANHIAAWHSDNQQWETLSQTGGGDGTDGIVHALLPMGSRLIVAGQFQEAEAGAASPQPASRVALWHDNQWSTLGTGIRGFSVYSLANLNGLALFLGGSFAGAGNLISVNAAVYQLLDDGLYTDRFELP